jgi:hypothetical protein
MAKHRVEVLMVRTELSTWLMLLPAMCFSSEREFDKGHGRLETRQCTVTQYVQWVKDRHPQ